MPPGKRVLVVDDEQAILDLLEFILEDGGFEVRGADRGDTALRVAETWRPDLVILDLGLPGLDGLEVCRSLHAAGVPVLVLSSHDRDDQVVEGLEEGADDYVTKPFNHRELLLRVEKLLSRHHGDARGSPTGDPSRRDERGTFSIRDLLIDPDRNEVIRAGKTISLTQTEYRVLELLARTPDKPVSVETILATVWYNAEWEGGQEIVKVNIRRLRRKIEPNPARPTYIHNRRGLGYYLSSKPNNL